mmetsp:Transcript_3126/g.3968  ORF Transcript_3126/g.3968 Transcript_3126/m.3968 type:complete len:313 (+) Transcript_3126:107-1045(+)
MKEFSETNVIEVLWTGIILLTFFSTKIQFFGDAMTYGRLREKKKEISGCKRIPPWLLKLAQCQVPKKWFRWFYVFALSFNGIFLTYWSVRWYSQIYISDIGTRICLKLDSATIPEERLQCGRIIEQVFLQLHFLRRVVESFVVTKFSESKMPIGVFIGGLCFYGLLIFTCATDALKKKSDGETETKNIPRILWFIGFFFFFVASFNQFKCHWILSKLRLDDITAGQKIQNNSLRMYSIPTGNLFDVISCAHYFWEIILYLSIWLMKQNICTFLVLFWVSYNLSITADKTHQWYHSKFDDYPENRKRLIPLFW